MTTVYNPFSAGLDKNPKMNVGLVALKHRDCVVYQNYSSHYVYTQDGIVFTERCGLSAQVIDTYIDGDDSDYHGCKRPRDAYKYGIKNRV